MRRGHEADTRQREEMREARLHGPFVGVSVSFIIGPRCVETSRILAFALRVLVAGAAPGGCTQLSDQLLHYYTTSKTNQPTMLKTITTDALAAALVLALVGTVTAGQGGLRKRALSPACTDVQPPKTWKHSTCAAQLAHTDNCRFRREGVNTDGFCAKTCGVCGAELRAPCRTRLVARRPGGACPRERQGRRARGRRDGAM